LIHFYKRLIENLKPVNGKASVVVNNPLLTAKLRLTPVTGGGEETPHCSLLDVDGFNSY